MSVADYDPFGDARVKHLELIQDVVARLSNAGFVVKGWALTLAGAFFAFAADGANPTLAILAAIPTLFFWGLDGYFLSSERLFRYLYDAVRRGDPAAPAFFMAATSRQFISALSERERSSSSVRTSLFRPSVGLFYGLILAATVGLWIALGMGLVTPSSPAEPIPSSPSPSSG